MTTVSAATRVAAVLGYPVRHSRSPALHNAAFAAAGIDARFVAFEVAPADLGAAVAGMRAMGFLGASITVPHKQAVMACCDRIDPVAEAIGAVNCLAFDGADLVGHNTDAGGFADSVAELGVSVAGASVVLLGSGGASRALAAGLAEAGATRIVVAARTPANADWAGRYAGTVAWTEAALAPLLAACDLLVDCTPVGLKADGDGNYPAPVDVTATRSDCVVASLVYHRKPALLAAAAACGRTTLDGAGMLVYQGARAFSLWTGQAAPVQDMWRAMRASLS